MNSAAGSGISSLVMETVQVPLQKARERRPSAVGQGLPAAPDKVQAGNNALQLLLFLPLLCFWVSV